MSIFFCSCCRASGRADTLRIATSSGLADVAERGHIDSSTHGDSVENHVGDLHKAVDSVVLTNNVDQKMLIFDINVLEDKHLNTILNRSCYFSRIPNCDTQSYEKWKTQSDFNFGVIPMGEF